MVIQSHKFLDYKIEESIKLVTKFEFGIGGNRFFLADLGNPMNTEIMKFWMTPVELHSYQCQNSSMLHI